MSFRRTTETQWEKVNTVFRKHQECLTRAQKYAIAEYMEDQSKLLEAIAAMILGRLMVGPRCSIREIAETLSAVKGLRRWSDPAMLWRTKVIISTAAHAGAFRNHGFELRRGRGFVASNKTQQRAA